MYILNKDTINLKENVNLNLLKSDRYTDISLFFCFDASNSQKEINAICILKDMLSLTCMKYPTKEEMIRQRNLLYGAQIESFIQRKSNRSEFTFKFIFVNPKYLKDIDDGDLIEFVDEVLFNPLFSEDIFKESKRIFKENILRRLERPSAYAANRMFEILSEEDSRFANFGYDFVKSIDDVALEDVKDVYQRLLYDYRKEIYLTGDFSEELLNYVKGLKIDGRKPFRHEPVAIPVYDKGYVEENGEVIQASLFDVYRLNKDTILHGKDYFALFVGSFLLGQSPTSFLFSEVREKQSLCYDISVNDYKTEGYFIISTSISSSNKEKCLVEIDRQIKRLINKDYDDVLIDIAKNLLSSSLIADMDNVDAIVNFYFARSHSLKVMSFEDLINGINSVTKDDIADLYKDYKHCLTYMYKEK